MSKEAVTCFSILKFFSTLNSIVSSIENGGSGPLPLVQPQSRSRVAAGSSGPPSGGFRVDYNSVILVRATEASATIFGGMHAALFPGETDGDSAPYSARLGDGPKCKSPWGCPHPAGLRALNANKSITQPNF